MAFIEMKNVSFTYPTSNKQAIDNISLEIERGQFIVLFGASGSGKSTLLRLLKKEIQPHGELKGEISINQQSLKTQTSGTNTVGFVFQDPENQVISDDVLQELVFGLENRGVTTNEMRNRVAEMVHFFGFESLLHQKTYELSGGMKQQINLASVLLMQPDIIILDEPTSQLDPVSTREFLDILLRLNEEFGMTIILAEHRLDEVFTIADKIIMMENGVITQDGEPRTVMNQIWDTQHQAYVPSIPSLYLTMTEKGERKRIPLSVKEGRQWIQHQPLLHDGNLLHDHPVEFNDVKLIDVKNLFFRYRRDVNFVLQELDFSLKQGEIYALLGGNGSGKSTFLKILSNIHKPNHGKMKFQSKQIGYLPQNPKLCFLYDTVEKEIQETLKRTNLSKADEANTLLQYFEIDHLRSSHPYDLSGGEMQKAALVCLLLQKPHVLVLDEPTKGLDPLSKQKFAQYLLQLQQDGISIIMSTHDIEFAAKYATRCGMMFEGKITTENKPKSFFSGNFFYTTMIQRVLRNLRGGVITLEEAVQLWEEVRG